MPRFAYASPDLATFGPTVELQVRVPLALARVMLHQRKPVPPAVTVTAMIDTGATWCAFTPDVFSRLELSPFDQASVATAANRQLRDLYDVDIELGGHRLHHVNAIDSSLVGRNVLSKAVLWYDGRRNQYSLEF